MSDSDTLAHDSDRHVVDDRTFILATRETGYRDVAAAVAELIDNSLQAGARHVDVFVMEENRGAEPDDDPEPSARTVLLAVLDDGVGMDRDTLRIALRFGGTKRFDDRTGLGRFGMGLPNSSVSQTRRFEVYSWRRNSSPLFTYLDVDEVAAGTLQAVPEPTVRPLPRWLAGGPAHTGTLVLWSRCDRLSRYRAATIAKRLRVSLGRMYRYPIWEGVKIRINSDPVTAVDPLFRRGFARRCRATLYGSTLTYEFATTDRLGSSIVEVRFSELPVTQWLAWSALDKRGAGVVGGAGVSIVRAGREIDYGWHLMGAKRRENYDDWWRCEIRFAPALDELFGVTHSKQGIRPTAELREVLGPDLERIARTLNARVRHAFQRGRAGATAATFVATADHRSFPSSTGPRSRKGNPLRYSIRTAALDCAEAYTPVVKAGVVTLTLNREHPFFDRVYAPACEAPSNRERFHLDCLLLAAARADLAPGTRQERRWRTRMRRNWSDSLAVLLEHRRSR